MQLHARNMRQAATYWPPGTNDGFGGVGFGAPESRLVRWQDEAELFRDAAGQEVMSNAIVYVNEPVAMKGYLALGSSADADPRTVAGAREIRQLGASPNLAQTRVLHKVWL